MSAHVPTFTATVDCRKTENIPMAISRFNGRKVVFRRRPCISSWYNLLGLALIPIRRTMAASITLNNDAIEISTANTDTGSSSIGTPSSMDGIAIPVVIFVVILGIIIFVFRTWNGYVNLAEMSPPPSSFVVDLEAVAMESDCEDGVSENTSCPYFVPVSIPIMVPRSVLSACTPCPHVENGYKDIDPDQGIEDKDIAAQVEECDLAVRAAGVTQIVSEI